MLHPAELGALYYSCYSCYFDDAEVPMRALEYLLVMTQDEGVSATATMVGRLQLSPTSLMSYRRLLTQRQVIE